MPHRRGGHLARYYGKLGFRYHTRKITDTERTDEAFIGAVPTEVADKLKALGARSASYGRSTRFYARRPDILLRRSRPARSNDDHVY